MRLSYKEKIKWAKQIRDTAPLKAHIPDEYRACLNQVEIEECLLDTREGKTHIYVIHAKKKTDKSRLFINIHGGGFALGHFERDLVFSSKMAVCLEGTVIDIDYKLAPEYGYPVALHECYDVVQWAFEHSAKLKADPEKIIVGGHSAGANLTAALIMKRNEEKKKLPVLAVLDYPALDFTAAADHGVANAGERMRAFTTFYTDNIEEVIRSPFVSPLLAPDELLKGMPATLVITAENDGLRFQGMEFAARLRELGVSVREKCFPDSGHGFVVYGNGQRDQAHQLILQNIQEVSG